MTKIDDNIKPIKRKYYNKNKQFVSNEPVEKKSKHVFFDENNSDNINVLSSNSVQISREYIVIKRDIKTLEDLIKLGKEYDKTKDYNISMNILYDLINPLTELNNMIGMHQLKQELVDHILFRIQILDNITDMNHTIIYGSPGVGKTEVARIIGNIYLAMGILTNNTFIKVKRSDLVAGYLGQTAKATQKCIDNAKGGVLFIDEVYSLGSKEQRDSFAKECIDTLTENLTEHKQNFICIVAGYKKEVEECFFAINKGLDRRFPVRFTIDKYSAQDLFEIFKKKLNDIKWSMDNTITVKFFEDNYEYFNYFGGDIENLIMRIKRSHSRRIFNSDAEKKVINIKDLKLGFNIFKQTKEINEKSESWKQMFI